MQMKDWLSGKGIETESLGKKQVAQLMKEVPDDLKEVLRLRQKTAKSSVRKYQAMETAVCRDGRGMRRRSSMLQRLERDGGSAHGHHEHIVARTQNLVVDVHADDRMRWSDVLPPWARMRSSAWTSTTRFWVRATTCSW